MNLIRVWLAALVIVGEVRILDWFLHLLNLPSDLAVFGGITGIIITWGLAVYALHLIFRRKRSPSVSITTGRGCK